MCYPIIQAVSAVAIAVAVGRVYAGERWISIGPALAKVPLILCQATGDLTVVLEVRCCMFSLLCSFAKLEDIAETN